MKSGSTSIFSWLEQAYSAPAKRPKEPRYFASPSFSHEGLSRYFLAACGGSATAIDGSVGYFDPAVAQQVADRFVSASTSAILPRPKFIVVVRDPVARSLSHVRHDIRRGRLGQLGPQDMADLVRPGQPYFELSRLATAVAPLLSAFDPDDFLVVDAASDDARKWDGICAFVGIGPVSPRVNADRKNETSATRSYTPALAWLSDRGVLKHLEQLAPRRVRPIASRLLLRSPLAGVNEMEVKSLIRNEVLAQLADEHRRFDTLTAGCAHC